jgi:hypothetical protein
MNLALGRIPHSKDTSVIMEWGCCLLSGTVRFDGNVISFSAEANPEETRRVLVQFSVLSHGDDVPTGPGWTYLGSDFRIEREWPVPGEPGVLRQLSAHVYVRLPTAPEESGAILVK